MQLLNKDVTIELWTKIVAVGIPIALLRHFDPWALDGPGTSFELSYYREIR